VEVPLPSVFTARLFLLSGIFYKQPVKTHNTLPVGEQKCLDIIKSITVGLTGDGIPMTMSSLKQ
ncbi:hypothetical protein EL06_25305, partial [Salmonella enterica subsp. diarizonae]|nr:hypothetical protein [Salmonella enterica subsp. diarizonae]